MKSTLKSAVGLVSNKQVSLSQIVGKWRLYQEVWYASKSHQIFQLSFSLHTLFFRFAYLEEIH